MTPVPDPHAAEAKARQLLDQRIGSVRTLVTARQALADLRKQVSEAEAADMKAYRTALAEGWSRDELRQLGLDDAGPRRASKRRASRTPKAPRDETTHAPTGSPDEA